MIVDNKIEVCEVPHNIENEQQILGSIIINDKLVKGITDTVTYNMFYQPLHRKIFKAMMYLHLNNIGIGYETLLEYNSNKIDTLFNLYSKDKLKARIYYMNDTSDFIKEKYPEKMFSEEELLAESIKMGLEAAKNINKVMKWPQNIEYEKTFWPFCIFSKKRYFGNKYEHNTYKYKQTSMGIVLMLHNH